MPTVSRSLRRFVLLTALVVALVALSPALVLASGWSQVASTCTPDDNASLTPNRRVSVKYDFRGGMFQFQPWARSTYNQFGRAVPITVRCHVLNPYEVTTPYWQQLIVSYQDPDGPGTDSRVVARLMRSLRPSGGHVVATFDSDMHAATGAGVVDQSVSFDNVNLNFSNSDYFVEIHLYRTTQTSNPRVLRVRLDE